MVCCGHGVIFRHAHLLFRGSSFSEYCISLKNSRSLRPCLSLSVSGVQEKEKGMENPGIIVLNLSNTLPYRQGDEGSEREFRN